MPILAVRTVTARLALITAVFAAIFVLVQSATALLTIVTAPGRRVGIPRAFDLWFAGHVPYSIWILLLPIITLIPAAPLDVMAITIVVPAVWTTFIATAYCRTVLGATAAAARGRVAVHQAVTLTTLAAYGLWAAGGLDAVDSYVLRIAGLR